MTTATTGKDIARARELAAAIEAQAGCRCVIDARNVNPPCLLIVPIPARDYSAGMGTAGGGYVVTWSIWAMSPGPGNLDAAVVLGDLVDAVAELLPGITTLPTAYTVPGRDPTPAVLITFTERL